MAIYKKMIKNIEKNIFYKLHIQSSNKIGYLSLFELFKQDKQDARP